jgi:predicted small secreted protein
MKTGFLSVTLFAAILAGPTLAQVGQDLKAAGQSTTDAAKTGAKKTGHAVKKGATTSTNAVEKGATKSTHAVKKGVHKGATAVSDHSQDTSTH